MCLEGDGEASIVRSPWPSEGGCAMAGEGSTTGFRNVRTSNDFFFKLSVLKQAEHYDTIKINLGKLCIKCRGPSISRVTKTLLHYRLGDVDHDNVARILVHH